MTFAVRCLQPLPRGRSRCRGLACGRRCPAYAPRMCRSIKTLRAPYVAELTEEEVRAAALQYVRKVSGFRTPAPHNAAVFDAAVDTIAAATRDLLDGLEVRGQRSMR